MSKPLSAVSDAQNAPRTFDNPPKNEGVRETFESIIVALILAFVFRAFVVEAFVIPTGSMAPSLRGMHANHRCANCQYCFAYGIKEPVIIDGRQHRQGTLAKPYSVKCPNCGWDGAGNTGLNSLESPVIPCSGDRILVLKWPYDIGGALLGPKRWDVGVFKNPQDGEMNYIKRIVGVPGEVLEIIDGDVYTAKADTVPAEILDILRVPVPDRELAANTLSELSRRLKIQRKTDLAQESLWMLHYDHDFPSARNSQDSHAYNFDPPHWAPHDSDSGWDAGGPVVRYEPKDPEWRWLELAGHAIQDDYGYNNVSTDHDQQSGPYFVGDVRLRFVATPRSSDGELALRISKGQDRFQVTINAAGDVQLDKIDMTGLPRNSEGIHRKLATGRLPRPLSAREPVQFELQNLDYRVSLKVDGVEVVATSDEDYSPDAQQLMQMRGAPGPNDYYSRARLSIGVRAMPLEMRHLQVHRDVYYTSRTHLYDPEGGAHSASGEPAWGT
ncbi:MAG TPA: S26 family signal peptidase, partial [Phycisphaerae bacterium]|nr:S26 family signal peptidase [Phycisphaerae bacterium]